MLSQAVIFTGYRLIWRTLFLSFSYIRHYSMLVANCVIYARDHSQLTGTIILFLPSSLNCHYEICIHLDEVEALL